MKMNNNELSQFRENWIHELHGEIRNKSSDRTCSTKSSKQEKSGKTIDSCNNFQQKPGHFQAFHIANDYLRTTSSQCKYCLQEQQTESIVCFCTKRKPTTQSQHSETVFNEKKKRKIENPSSKHFFSKDSLVVENEKPFVDGNFLDLLISDIDEITCIPFFEMELPKELALLVFQYLSVQDLVNCCLVNSKWKILAEDDLLWYNLCVILDVPQNAVFMSDRPGWKAYVKESVLERRRIRRKWKERLCEVDDLENEKGGIICSASISHNTLVAAYLDGSVKLWNLSNGSFGHNLKEQYTVDEDVLLSMCTCTCMQGNICAAGFENGDLMIWRTDHRLDGELIHMENFNAMKIEDVMVAGDFPSVCFLQQKRLVVLKPVIGERWNWKIVIERRFDEQVKTVMFLHSLPLQLASLTQNRLRVHATDSDDRELDTLAGATFACVDCKADTVAVGVNGFGYSALSGYRVRRYCVSSGKQLSSIVGSQVLITCLKFSDCYGDSVVIGCSDYKIRLHDLKSETLQFVLNGANSYITTLQMDKWKVVSGHLDGSVCLWDYRTGALCWKTLQKHPTRVCHFDENMLTCVNIPDDKYPKNSYWYADDLTQHRKHRGHIRVLNFTKERSAVGVPRELRADYDDITGYDYNIQLIAPYDDVENLNLPKI